MGDNTGDFGNVTSLNLNLLDMPYAVFNEICSDVDVVPGLVDKLIATQDNTEYQLSIVEVARCRHHSQLSGLCEQVLHVWGNKGMTVQELINILDRLRLERPLSRLVQPMPLKLVKDIPNSLTLEEGDTLKLDCSATGFPYPRYCWFRNKQLICQNDTGQLEITNVGLNDTGTYICRVHNELKKLDEIQWTSKCDVFVEESLHTRIDGININDVTIPDSQHPVSIHFTKQPPKELRVKFGEPLRLEVAALGPQPLLYLWCRDRAVITGASVSPVLEINSMSHNESGTYQCTVFNKEKQMECKSNECEVKLVYPTEPSTSCADIPVITLQPTDKQESINGIAVFLVEAQCVHNLHYQWYHNGRPLPGCTNNELRFVVKQRDQEGDYQCQISVDSGHSLMSRVAKLKVDSNKKGSAYYATDKLAILFGQSNYRGNNKQLPAAKNDLYEAHKVFSSFGFKTISCLDNTLDEMKKVVHFAIDMMRDSANNNLYVVMYVVGHGFVHHGVSYLMPSSATEGTQVCNCLSVECVQKTIIRELNPVVFLMILDICQTEINHVLQGQLPATNSGPVCKGMVIFRAATKGQEALEECQPVTSTVKGEASAKSGNVLDGWVDITHERRSRGIFSQALFNILRKSEKLVLHDLYKAFNDAFQRPDPTMPASKGKEQDPVFEINLEEERSLLDPINPQGQEKEYEVRMHKYNQFTSKSLPPDFYIPLSAANVCWNIRGSFRIKASNVLELILYEEDQRPIDERSDQLMFTIKAQSVPLQIRPCHYYRYDDDPELGIKQRRGFIFYNLQHLQNPLLFYLAYSASGSSNQIRVVVGYPLISRIWNMPILSKDYTPDSAKHEACEHSEG